MRFRLITRRAAVAGALLLPWSGAIAALPDRPVRIVLGFPPGSGPDVIARLLAEGLREAWPAGVVVDNKPGAAGAIAAQEVAKAAAPDGHTLLLGEVGQLAMVPSTYARLPYDPARDFAAIAEVASIDFAFVVPAAVPASDLAGYLAWAKARRDPVFMGTFGAGTPGHFGAAILAREAGLNAAIAGDSDGRVPDLILVDWMMPKMTGIEVCRALRDNPVTTRVPVILLTAKAQEAEVERGFAAGVDDYIVKPFSQREMLGRIQAGLARSEATA